MSHPAANKHETSLTIVHKNVESKETINELHTNVRISLLKWSTIF